MFFKNIPIFFKFSYIYNKTFLIMYKKQKYEDYKEIDGEVWKKIEGYDEYEVSNLGRVRIGAYILVPSDKCGYCAVKLYQAGKRAGKNVLVHRLVASAFVPNIENKPEVDHIDTNKENNCASNLRWCWHLENMVDNTNTYSKLNGNYKKRVIYESLRQDLFYQKKNGEEIKYSDTAKEKVKEVLGKDVDELLSTLTPSFFGKKTVAKLNPPEKNKGLKKVKLYIRISDLHTGMIVDVDGVKGKITSIDDEKNIILPNSEKISRNFNSFEFNII